MPPSIIDYQPFLDWLQNSDLEAWHRTLPDLIEERLDGRRWGDMPGWLQALGSLPNVRAQHYDFSAGITIGDATDITSEVRDQLQQALMEL
ncbi:MAG: tRNA 5-methoxyuridine(34)/uridine 5-oxyacetic acid(34) synthase CmoB, partial [Porticoccaceae bacterium]|nr:tRNA 5-methoxyuridine(34)/uridine 5-oxyacetic acid(34) synthase CmoB [Porticoccaceae bacterium]